MMLETIHDHVAAGVTRVVQKAAVLRCGKRMEKLHYYFSWIVSSRNRDKCEILPLETKKSGVKLLPHSDLRGGGFLRRHHAVGVTARNTDKSRRCRKEHHSFKIGTWNI
jgi:hypothetical protein